MTEPEVEALALRLTQAWVDRGSGDIPGCTFENGSFRFECEIASHVHLTILGLPNTVRAAMIQWQRCELVHNEGQLKQYTPMCAEAQEWQEIEALSMPREFWPKTWLDETKDEA